MFSAQPRGLNKHVKRETKQGLGLLAALFVICGVAIITLNVINYFQDGKFGTLSVFGFLIIFLGFWLYAQGKKESKDQTK